MPSFSDPIWLASLPPLVYLLWLIQQHSFSEGSPKRKKFWFAVRILLLLLLVAALAGFQMRYPVRRSQVLFLVDFSNSVDPDQRERALRLINESMSMIHSPDQAGVIVFGADAAVERFPAAPHPVQAFESRIDGSGTNLQNAIELAMASTPADYQRNLVLLTDGSENSGSAQSALATLRGQGASVQAFYLDPVHRPEAAIDGVRVPDEVHLKQPFHLEVVTSSNKQMPALLRVFRNGVLIQEGSLELGDQSKNLLRLPQTLDQPGVYRYQVQLNPKEDFHVQNNTREVWVSVEGPPRVLLVDEAPRDLRFLAEALQSRGFQIEQRSAHDFPLSLPEMLTYQSIFVRNVPASLIHNQMPLLRQYVHDFGGGFAMLGGQHSFGPGGYYSTPVEETLPVRMDLINKKYLADVAVVIVIDKSGSMSFTEKGKQKIDLADEGGARLATLLKRTDRLGVLAVDSVPKWAFALQPLSDQKSAIEAITSIRAGGGGIYVYSGLLEAYNGLKDIEAPVKHVILFADTADCEEKEGPTGISSLALAKQFLASDKITTTTIGIGQEGDVDVDFLRQVAAIGEGRFYFTSDMFTLPEIFTQESMMVQRYYINEERFTPAIQPAELLAGIDAAPDLLGYVATSPKPSAEVSILSHHKDPILATWRFGIGQSAAFTSDPTDKWGALWLQWPQYQQFWSQVARALTAQTQTPRFRVSFSQKNGNTTLLVDAVDETGALLNDLAFQSVLVDQEGKTNTLPLLQSEAGRYEATIPGQGNLFGKVFLMDQGRIQEEQTLQIPEAPDLEWRPDPRGKEHLAELADRIVDTPAQLRFPSKASVEVQSFLPQILLLSSLLFLLDIAFRKIDFSKLKLPEPKPVPAVAPSPVSTLKKVKARKAIPEIPVFNDLPKTVKPEPKEDRVNSNDYMERLKKAKRKTRED